MSAGFDVFMTSNDRQQVANYSDSAVGFALRAGWAYSEHTRQIFRYTLRNTNIYNVQPWASPVVQAQAGYATVSEVSETIAWDTRDSRLNTTKGWLLRNTVAVAGAIGTEQYLRTTADAVYYQSLGLEDVVISVGGSAGVVLPYNNSYIRLNNLFFLGGDNLRGFAVAGVGPRDAGTTDALGGQYFYTTTTELSFPLYGIPKEIGLLGKAFVDTGSLWGNQASNFGASILDSQLMRVGTGFGIQWISPFGPIRVDYTFPVVQEVWDKTQNFRFSFGTRF
jgi:outer membrane protein insertion porin family